MSQGPANSAGPTLKILTVGSHPDLKFPGGIITHMRIIRKLAALGSVDVFDVGSLHGTAAIQGRLALPTILANIARLRRLTRRHTYDLVLLHQPIATFALIKLVLVLVALPKPVLRRTLLFFHGGRFERVAFLRLGLLRRFARWTLGRARRAYFLSPAEHQGFVGQFGALPTAFFRNFADSDATLEHRPSPGPHLRLLYVGRVVQIKGVFDIIDAVRLLAGEGMPSPVVTFVGDGPDLERLRDHAAGLDVRFTGFLQGPALDEAYASADVFLLPTGHPEGFPYVVIEAMRAGLPIVSTSEGALETLVRNEVNGFQIGFGDIRSLANAIRQLADPTLRERIRRTNYTVFQRDLSLQGAERFYASLVAAECSSRSPAP